MTLLTTTKLLMFFGFLALWIVELVIAARQHATAPLYRWKDTLESWALLMMTAAISGSAKLFLLAVYAVALEHVALREWHGTVTEYIVAFLAYDLIAYLFHRASHRVGFLWAIHAVHHQSEQFNLTVAMRTAPLRNIVDWPTLLPLALLAVPAEWVMFLFLVHIVGQYWIHTQWIPKLPVIGWVVNTPSHHRVHHGTQRAYCDANYGANLIVYDRLFGTFRPEGEPSRYGVTEPVDGFDPLRSVFEPFQQIFARSRGWRLRDRIEVWFRPPGWTPAGMKPIEAPEPKSDFAIADLPDAIAATVLSSILLPSVEPALHTSWSSAGLLAVAGAFALWRVGEAIEREAHHPVRDAVVAGLLALAALVAPTHGLALLASALLLAGMAARRAWRGRLHSELRPA